MLSASAGEVLELTDLMQQAGRCGNVDVVLQPSNWPEPEWLWNAAW